MKHPRRSRALALVGGALLLASLVAPWMTYDNIWARPADQWFSPGAVLWNALRSTPYTINDATSVTLSLIAIGVTLAFVIAAVLLTRASRRPSERFATLAFVVVLAMIPYFAGTIFCALITPLAMEFSDGSGVGGVTVGVGMGCVILGGLLTIIGLTDMAR